VGDIRPLLARSPASIATPRSKRDAYSRMTIRMTTSSTVTAPPPM
jgi:hypothetical protein